MKKTIIVAVPMRGCLTPMMYTDNAKGKKGVYPIMKCLDDILSDGDELEIILIVKTYGEYQKNVERFYSELNECINNKNVTYNVTLINSDFDESIDVHEHLLLEVVKKIPAQSTVYADITYGPKDVPIVLFSALHFVFKFSGCKIGKIVYGMGKFKNDDTLADAELCNMTSLFHLHNFFSVVESESAEEAIKTLKLIVEKQ